MSSCWLNEKSEFVRKRLEDCHNELEPELLLVQATIVILTQSYVTMMNWIAKGKTPGHGKFWTFVIEMHSYADLIDAINATQGQLHHRCVRISVTDRTDILSGSHKIENLQENQFLVTFVTGRGTAEQKRVISSIPKEFDKFACGSISDIVKKTIQPIKLVNEID